MGRDMRIFLKLFLEVLIKRKSHEAPGDRGGGVHRRPVIAHDWFVLLETYFVRRSDLGSQHRFYSENFLGKFKNYLWGRATTTGRSS